MDEAERREERGVWFAALLTAVRKLDLLASEERSHLLWLATLVQVLLRVAPGRASDLARLACRAVLEAEFSTVNGVPVDRMAELEEVLRELPRDDRDRTLVDVVNARPR